MSVTEVNLANTSCCPGTAVDHRRGRLPGASKLGRLFGPLDGRGPKSSRGAALDAIATQNDLERLP
jgi:hypothetical protein